MQRLIGKVAIVAGGGCITHGWGNGKAIAVGFAREGAKVAVLDVRQDAAEATAAIIRQAGGEAIALRSDVTLGADVSNAVEKCICAFGKLDVLVDNVGTVVMGGPVETSEEDWERAFAVNVKGAFLLAKYALPEMLRNGGGSIITISSGASTAYAGVPYVAYAASKAALNQLTRHIALMYAERGIRANAILPGLIDTPMAYLQAGGGYASPNDLAAIKGKRARLSPTGAQGTAWDVAHAAIYLASDESAYVNAVLLDVDGGYTKSSPGPKHVS